MPLTIALTVQPSGTGQPIATIALAGSLDTATAPELEQQLKPLLDGPAKNLLFDLNDLQFISSAGLRVFAAARKRLRERGGHVSFVHLQPQIQKVFEIVAALPGIGIFRDVREADAYLAQRQREAS
jgi:anti-anti-sigma factor